MSYLKTAPWGQVSFGRSLEVVWIFFKMWDVLGRVSQTDSILESFFCKTSHGMKASLVHTWDNNQRDKQCPLAGTSCWQIFPWKLDSQILSHGYFIFSPHGVTNKWLDTLIPWWLLFTLFHVLLSLIQILGLLANIPFFPPLLVFNFLVLVLQTIIYLNCSKSLWIIHPHLYESVRKLSDPDILN